MTPRGATTYTRKPTANKTHAILTILTAGGWLVVWLPLLAWRRYGPQRKTSVTVYH